VALGETVRTEQDRIPAAVELGLSNSKLDGVNSGGGGDTANPLHGRAHNPYDLERTPAGSSGGEAAAIASGMSACGLGSDSGGSLRMPAHFCGIATLNPRREGSRSPGAR